MSPYPQICKIYKNNFQKTKDTKQNKNKIKNKPSGIIQLKTISATFCARIGHVLQEKSQYACLQINQGKTTTTTNNNNKAPFLTYLESVVEFIFYNLI